MSLCVGLQGGAGVNLLPSPRDQQRALSTAITELLWQASESGGGSASVALPPSAQERMGGGLVHEQLMRGCAFVTASSKESLHVRGQAQVALVSCGCVSLVVRGCKTALAHALVCPWLGVVYCPGGIVGLYGPGGMGRRSPPGLAASDPGRARRSEGQSPSLGPWLATTRTMTAGVMSDDLCFPLAPAGHGRGC